MIHTPKLFADLQLHHTKRKALLHWLTAKAAFYNPSSSRKIPTLVLYGSSGIGKSSAIELLCDELSVTMTTWQQDMIECDSRSFSTLYHQKRQEQSRMFEEVVIPSIHRHQGIVKDLFQVHYHESGRREQVERYFTSARYPSLDFIEKDGTTTPLMNKTNERKPAHILLIHDPVSIEEGNAFEVMNQHLVSAGLPLVVIVSGAYGREDQHAVLNSTFAKSIRDCLDIDAIYWSPLTTGKIAKQLRIILRKEKIPSNMISEDELLAIVEESGGDMRHAITELEMLVTYKRFKTTIRHCSVGQKASGGVIVDLLEDSDEENMIQANQRTSSAPPLAKRPRTIARIGQDSEDDYGIIKDKSSSTTVEDRNGSGRDVTVSGLHIVAKFMHAKLDKQGLADVDFNQIVQMMDCSCDYLLSMCSLNSLDFIQEHMSIPIVDQAISSLSLNDEERSWQILEAVAVNANILSDAEVLLSRKFNASAHLDRSLDDTFPEPYVQHLCARAAVVAKGWGLAELYLLAKERLGFKGAFRSLRAGGMHMFRSRRTQTVMELREMRINSIKQWLNAVDQEKEDIEREEGGEGLASLHWMQQVNTPCLGSTIPIYSMEEWALTVLPFCRTLAAPIANNSSSSESNIPLLVSIVHSLDRDKSRIEWQ
eukprot:gene8138-8977_t